MAFPPWPRSGLPGGRRVDRSLLSGAARPAVNPDNGATRSMPPKPLSLPPPFVSSWLLRLRLLPAVNDRVRDHLGVVGTVEVGLLVAGHEVGDLALAEGLHPGGRILKEELPR